MDAMDEEIFLKQPNRIDFISSNSNGTDFLWLGEIGEKWMIDPLDLTPSLPLLKAICGSSVNGLSNLTLYRSNSRAYRQCPVDRGCLDVQ